MNYTTLYCARSKQRSRRSSTNCVQTAHFSRQRTWTFLPSRGAGEGGRHGEAAPGSVRFSCGRSGTMMKDQIRKRKAASGRGVQCMYHMWYHIYYIPYDPVISQFIWYHTIYLWYHIYDIVYYIPMISCNCDIISSWLWYHSQDIWYHNYDIIYYITLVWTTYDVIVSIYDIIGMTS